MAEIIYIETSKLYPHPDNPRRELGDLEELADRENEAYWGNRWDGGYNKCVRLGNEGLDMLYAFLESLGYEMSDEEMAMRDGTHELLREEETDDV